MFCPFDDSVIHILGHNFGRWVAVLMALVSSSSMNLLATMGLMEEPMNLLIILTLEGTMGILRQISKSVVMFCIDMEVL